jgi:cytidylate kinase
MGTVVFPDADHKFFLRADPAERARRRHAELRARAGADAPAYEVVAQELERRDERDSTRDAAPLRRAEDAVDLDTTGLDVAEVLERILAHIARTRPNSAP